MMGFDPGAFSLVFAPLLPLPLLGALALLALLAVGLALWRGLSGWWLRALGFAVMLFALAGPSVQREERAPLADIALILSDETGSNRLPGREAQAEAAREGLRERLTALGVEIRESVFGDAPEDGGTLLNGALAEALGEIPRDRLSGVFVLSDGLVHDAPATTPEAPVHLLATGTPQDWDRRLVVLNAPAFGILGEEITMTVRVEDEGEVPEALRGRPARVGFALNGDHWGYAESLPGEDLVLRLALDHGGENVLHFTTDPAEGELTGRNNEAVVQVHGIRDRLRVLLVSGEPHAGQRTWRNLLKADPSVDLVHFTILRPPDREDGVPVNELSLIAFPTRELFIEKIDEFDLIIFDRYRRRGILPNSYYENIRRYVEQGGALLVAGGPELAGAESIYYSPLGSIFPADPTGRLFEQPYLPRLTDLGARHPVTQSLEAAFTGTGLQSGAAREAGDPPWGRWLRQVELTRRAGEVVMEGHEGRPLLVLDRVGEGRVALLASDQAWLWDRGFEGGGPQGELLRRLAHWLMGEPDLEEEALTSRADGMVLEIIRQSLEDGPHEVVVTGPDGSETRLALTESRPGRFTARYDGGEPGVHRLASGGFEAVAVLGAGNPREFARTVADPAGLSALNAATGGGMRPLAEALPAIRRIEPGRSAEGPGWLGVVTRGAYVTTDLRLAAFLPAWAWLLLGAGLILAGWLREGRGEGRSAARG